MSNQKMENLLNLSLDATLEERLKAPDLNVGFNDTTDTWTIIIRYVKNLDILNQYSIEPTLLLGGYAILEVPETLIEQISALDEVIYVEKPKNLFFTVTEGRRTSCVSEIQNTVGANGNPASLSLFGSGCLVGIIDSGIDYSNPVFQMVVPVLLVSGTRRKTVLLPPDIKSERTIMKTRLTKRCNMKIRLNSSEL